MYNAKIDAIEKRIAGSTASEKDKIKLTALAEELRSELGKLDREKALELAVLAENGMFSSLKAESAKFILEHPRLARTANDFASLFAGIGI